MNKILEIGNVSIYRSTITGEIIVHKNSLQSYTLTKEQEEKLAKFLDDLTGT